MDSLNDIQRLEGHREFYLVLKIDSENKCVEKVVTWQNGLRHGVEADSVGLPIIRFRPTVLGWALRYQVFPGGASIHAITR